jgi:hypothetical protein
MAAARLATPFIFTEFWELSHVEAGRRELFLIIADVLHPLAKFHEQCRSWNRFVTTPLGRHDGLCGQGAIPLRERQVVPRPTIARLQKLEHNARMIAADRVMLRAGAHVGEQPSICPSIRRFQAGVSQFTRGGSDSRLVFIGASTNSRASGLEKGE